MNILLLANQSAVNPAQTGTKAGALYELNIPAGGSAAVRLCGWRDRMVRR